MSEPQIDKRTAIRISATDRSRMERLLATPEHVGRGPVALLRFLMTAEERRLKVER